MSEQTVVTDRTALDLTDPMDAQDRLLSIERFGIAYIPEEQRYSRPVNLLYILCGGSLTFSIFIIGWFPIAFGLGWWSAASAIAVGSVIGAALLAPMGLFGPRTGTNNPVSSGAFFGVVGRLIGTCLEASASLAFAALSIWTGGDALVAGLDAFFGVEDSTLSRVLCYGVLSVVVTVISICGHHLMVGVQRFMIPTAGLFALVGVVVFAGDFDAGYRGGDYLLGSFWPTWLASVLVALATVTSYGAYAGDWTRHISKRRFSDRKVLLMVFVGGTFGMGGAFMWGAFTSTAVFASGAGDADTPFVFGLVELAPLWFVPGLIYLGLASGTAQAVINTYGTGLDTSSIIPRLNRVQATAVACVTSAALVYAGYFWSGLIDTVSTFLNLLAVFSVPWIVILIIGFLRRRGFFFPDDLQVFNRGERGGRYWFTGGLNWRATGPWLLGAGVGLFFTNTAWFVGPGTELTSGTDVGFLVSGVIAAVLYALALKLFPEPRAIYPPDHDLEQAVAAANAVAASHAAAEVTR